MAVTARVYIGRFARWLWPGEPMDPTSAALTWTAAVLGVLVPVIVLLPVGPVVKTFAVLLFACTGPGASVICRVRLGNVAAAWAMAMVLSLSVMAAVAVVMAWLRFWHPIAGFVLLGAATAGASVPILVRRHWWPEELPRMPEVMDATTVMPRIVDAGPDATTIMPRIVDDSPATATSVMPVIRDDGWLTGAEASPAAGWPTGSGTHPIVSSPPTSGAGRLTAGDEDLPAGAKGWPVAGARPPDETSVLPVIREGWLIGAEGRALDEEIPPPVPAAVPRPSVRVDSVRVDSVRVDRVRVDAARPEPAGWRVARARSWPARLFTRRNLADALPLLIGVALWIFAVTHSDVGKVGDYGLLPAMHPTFFAAIVVCTAGFISELYRRDWRWPVLLGYIALLLLILHATVPAMVYEPEYAWTYKHIGVMEYIRTHGAADNAADIYLQWPTLFALGAQIVSVTGVSALRLGAWAPLFFDTLNCLPLFAIARTLSADRRVPFLTVFLFTAINWVAQDYLSPQAFTFVLCLGTLMIMLRWLRRVPGPLDRKPPRLILRLWAWLQNGLVQVPYGSARTRSIALGVLYFVYIVVATSHQLSPYIIALGATGLVALGLLQPLRIVPILFGIAVLYLLPRHQVVDNYGLFAGFNLFHNASGVGPMLGTTAGRVFSAHVVELLAVEVWGLAGLAVLDSRNRLGPVAVPAVLGFTPFALLLAQSYGGEAIYRVYLFTAPWCAYLIANMVLRWRWMPSLVGASLAALALAAAIMGCIQGEHGQLTFNKFTPDEVRAAEYVYTHAPPGSAIVTTFNNFPTRLTADYPKFQGGPNNDLALVPAADLVGHTLTDADLPAIDAYFTSKGPAPAFLIISPSMKAYAHFFGYVPDGAIDTLQRTVAGSPNFTLYYRNQDVVIYRYVP